MVCRPSIRPARVVTVRFHLAAQLNEKMAKQWCNAHGGCPYFETSAKTDKNVDAAFDRVVRLALEAEPDDEP